MLISGTQQGFHDVLASGAGNGACAQPNRRRLAAARTCFAANLSGPTPSFDNCEIRPAPLAKEAFGLRGFGGEPRREHDGRPLASLLSSGDCG